MPTVLVNSDVPQKIRSLSSLDPDYVDCVAVARSVTDRSPEEWARATVEGVSPWGRFIAWRVLCGLRLESGSSPEFIAGWKIADRGDNWIRLEATSWFMSAQIVLHVDKACVSLATFVRY